MVGRLACDSLSEGLEDMLSISSSPQRDAVNRKGCVQNER